MKLHIMICDISSRSTLSVKKNVIVRENYIIFNWKYLPVTPQYEFIGLHASQVLAKRKNQLVLKVENNVDPDKMTFAIIQLNWIYSVFKSSHPSAA